MLLLPISLATALATSACASPSGSTAAPGAGSASAAAIIEASNLPKTIPAPLPDDPMAVTIHRLSNGMTVYISTDREKPRFSAYLPVRTGSRNDPSTSTGLAHYLEHMLFKGTDELGTTDMAAERPHIEEIERLYMELRAAEDDAARQETLTKIDRATQESSKFSIPNELSRLYAQMGIDGLNAYTWLDETVYIADVPSNRLEAWAAVEVERFSDPVFRLFYPELEAVYEEKNISLDSPYRRVNEAMMKSMFPGHPYGTQPTIGLVEHLKTPAYQDMVDYFQDWYGPNNMAIVLAGDIDAETAIPVLEASFGRLPVRKLGTAAPAEVTPMSSRVERVIEAEGETSIVLAWQTVPAKHEDRAALEVLDMLVDNGSSGLLNIALTTTQKVARAGSSPTFVKEAGWWRLSATAKEGQTPEELETLLLGVIDDLKRGSFSDDDLEAVKLADELQFQLELEYPGARVSKMTDAFIQGWDWPDMVASRARLQAVTREDVLRVARQYVGDAYAAVKRIPGSPELPKIEKPTISPVALDPSRKSGFSQRILGMEATPIEPKWLVEGEAFERAEAPSGVLLTAHNERNKLFLVSYRFDVGSWRSPGLCFALDLAQRSGTATKSNESIKKTLSKIGVDISVSCSDHATTVSVSGIDDKMEQGLALVQEWLGQVVIEDEALENAKNTKIGIRNDNLESPRFLGWALTSFGRRGGESAFLHQLSNVGLKKLTRGDVEALSRGLFSYRREVRYFGPRARAEVEPLLLTSEGLGATERREPNRYRRVERPTIYFLHRDVAKSSVSITVPRPPGEEVERASAEVWSSYLSGGMGGLIFQEVREARGLAYSAYAFVSTGSYADDEWFLGGSLGTQGDKTVDALTLMLELLLEHRFDTNTVSVAKAAMEEEFRTGRISPRRIPRKVSSWERAGLSGDPRPARRERTKSLSVDELQAWSDAVVKGDTAPVITVLGNRETVDLEALAAIGEVIEVKPEDLVSW